MAYRTSRAPFDELKSVIEDLFEQRETLIIHTEVPRRLGWRLREALHCCRYHNDLTKYLVLEKLYSFETHDDYVRARYRGSDDITKIEVRPGDREKTRRSRGPKTMPEPEPPEEEREPIIDEEKLDETTAAMNRATNTCILKQVTNLAGIIEGTKRYGVRVMEVFFPDARLTEQDMARLFRWTSENGWLIVDMEDAGLTLSKREEAAELQWKP